MVRAAVGVYALWVARGVGCVVGIPDIVTAVTFVALGASSGSQCPEVGLQHLGIACVRTAPSARALVSSSSSVAWQFVRQHDGWQLRCLDRSVQ